MDRANVTKWIYASVCKHFSSLPNLHIKGQVRKTEQYQNWYELKVDGPYLHELSRNYWKVKIEIDVQVYSKQDREYLYTNQELQGKALELFTNTISIYKLGNKPVDTGDYLFCLKIDSSDRHSLDVANFGFTEGDEKLDVSDIEGHYYNKIKNF